MNKYLKNGTWFDFWSVIHIFSGVIFCVVCMRLKKVSQLKMIKILIIK